MFTKNNFKRVFITNNYKIMLKKLEYVINFLYLASDFKDDKMKDVVEILKSNLP
jgi:hypothetical protein